MDHLDTSWCPTCDRQILPKRTEVPIASPATEALPPSPTKPAAALPAIAPKLSRTKTTTVGRPRGLVHGTGRAKALAQAKRTKRASKSPSAPLVEPTPPPSPAPIVEAAAVKTRTVIDQGPTPLYCSDACRLYDLHQLSAGLPSDFDPARTLSTASVTARPGPEDASTSSSSESEASSTSSVEAYSVFTYANAHSYEEMDPSVATLARIYGFPALGATPPLMPEEPKPRVIALDELNSGVMMAGRRIKAILHPEQPKSKKFTSPTAKYTASVSLRDRKPIPGWTDGSDAWRAAVYSMAAPKDWTVHDPNHPDAKPASYTSYAATPHRSTAGVTSTLGDDPEGAERAFAATVGVNASSAPSARMQELYDTFPLMKSTRSAARCKAASRPSSCPDDSAPVRRYRDCISPMAAAKLLVPDVKIRRSFSSASVSSSTGSSGLRSPRSLARRMSAMSGEDAIAEEGPFRPSYPVPPPPLNGLPRAPVRQKTPDDLLTYTMPQLMVREKRTELQVVDGAQVEVVVEVEVPKEVKRLFLGPDGVNEHWARFVAKREAAEYAARRQK